MESLNNTTGYVKIQNKSLFSIRFKVMYISLGKIVGKVSNSILFSKSYKIDLPKDAQSITISVYKNILGKEHLFYYEKLKQIDSKCYEVTGTVSKTVCKSINCK